MARITGIGGVFIKAKGDAKALTSWYEKHLGLKLEAYGGAVLKWPEDKGADGGATAWHVAESASQWFSPSAAGFMVNYRVDDLEGIIAQLAAAGIALQQGPEVHEQGTFAWVMDPDGNKVELWEPTSL